MATPENARAIARVSSPLIVMSSSLVPGGMLPPIASKEIDDAPCPARCRPRVDRNRACADAATGCRHSTWFQLTNLSARQIVAGRPHAKGRAEIDDELVATRAVDVCREEVVWRPRWQWASRSRPRLPGSRDLELGKQQVLESTRLEAAGRSGRRGSCYRRVPLTSNQGFRGFNNREEAARCHRRLSRQQRQLPRSSQRGLRLPQPRLRLQLGYAARRSRPPMRVKRVGDAKRTLRPGERLLRMQR